MKKNISLYEDILKLSTFATLFLIVVGFIDLKIFYSHFGININNYVLASEIIILSLDNLFAVIIATAIQIYIWHTLFKKIIVKETEESLSSEDKSSELIITDRILKALLKNRFFKIEAISLIVLLIVFTILRTLFPSVEFLHTIRNFIGLNYILFMFIFLAWFPSTRSVFEILKARQYYNPKLFLIFLIFSTSILASIWAKNMFTSAEVMKYGNKSKITLILDKETISNGDTLRYLGRTDNYFFFWNKITKESIVYPNSEVKEIRLQ